MKRSKSLLAATLVAAALAGCAHMTAQEKNTAIGAAVGGVGGSVLTNGDPLGTVGGAVVGGAIGSQIRR